MSAGTFEPGPALGSTQLVSLVKTARGSRHCGRRVAAEAVPEFLRTEALVLGVLRQHPHAALPQLQEVVPSSDGSHMLVFGPVDADLHAELCQRKHFSEAAARAIFAQLVAAVAHAHAHRIVLRDLKLGKIFFRDRASWDIVIADLTTAQIVPEGDGLLRDQRGSPAYVSPEVLKCQPYDGAAADVWGLGVILFVLLTGTYPFHDKQPASLFAKIQNAAQAVRFPPTVSESSKLLITQLLSRDPCKRPTAQQLLAHPWVALATPELPPRAAAPSMARLLPTDEGDVFADPDEPDHVVPELPKLAPPRPVPTASPLLLVTPPAAAAAAASAPMDVIVEPAAAAAAASAASAASLAGSAADADACVVFAHERRSVRRSSRIASQTSQAPYPTGQAAVDARARRRSRSSSSSALGPEDALQCPAAPPARSRRHSSKSALVESVGESPALMA